MFKINQKLRCINKIQDLCLFESYKVLDIVGCKISVSYDDGYQPKQLRAKLFDCSNFRLISKKCPFNVGDEVCISLSKKYPTIADSMFDNLQSGWLKLSVTYKVNRLHPSSKDKVCIYNDKGIQFWIFVDNLRTGNPPARLPSFL